MFCVPALSAREAGAPVPFAPGSHSMQTSLQPCEGDRTAVSTVARLLFRRLVTFGLPRPTHLLKTALRLTASAATRWC